MKSVSRCHAIKDEDSIKVVQLVLDRASLEALGPKRRARGLDDDSLGASDVRGDVREAEASLSPNSVPRGLEHTRVDENDQPGGRSCVTVAPDVNHRHSDELPYLGRGQADAAGMSSHRIDEVGGDTLGGQSACVYTPLREHGVGKDQYRSDQVLRTLASSLRTRPPRLTSETI